MTGRRRAGLDLSEFEPKPSVGGVEIRAGRGDRTRRGIRLPFIERQRLVEDEGWFGNLSTSRRNCAPGLRMKLTVAT